MNKETATSAAKHCEGQEQKQAFRTETITDQRSAQHNNNNDNEGRHKSRYAGIGDGFWRGDMLSWNWFSAGFVWGRLNDSDCRGIGCQERRAQGIADVTNLAGEVVWRCELCFKWAACLRHSECCWQGVTWPWGYRFRRLDDRTGWRRSDTISESRTALCSSV